jgi:hypothetical protein
MTPEVADLPLPLPLVSVPVERDLGKCNLKEFLCMFNALETTLEESFGQSNRQAARCRQGHSCYTP